ncbi:MAG: hypothetical protein JWO45_1886 [Spartobacteria bacterium]|nr:hypothetical protein [Spartobacteria bacterium]
MNLNSGRKLDKKVREYLAYIGSIGGSTSRRRLMSKQARQMVAIREAKRAAIKAGNAAWARKRVRLPKERPERVRESPEPRLERVIG